jgi:hypothetical protein
LKLWSIIWKGSVEFNSRSAVFFIPARLLAEDKLVEQNLSMKKELSATERRLNARNDRIYQLEQLVTGQEHKLMQREQRYAEEVRELKRQVSLGKLIRTAPRARGTS